MKTNKKSKFNVWNILTLIILAILVFFIVYPLILVLKKSVITPTTGEFTMSYFQKFFGKKFYWSTLVNSFKVTIISTLLAVAIGLPIAYVMRKVRIKGNKLIEILIIISYLSPPFIGAYAWIQLLGRNGIVTKGLNTVFGISSNGIYGFGGIVLVFTLQSFPLIYIRSP